MKIFILMQTHTDIGYTDRQEKIMRYHVDYLKQAIRISEAIRQGERPEWEGFVWNNESFWIIEEFLKQTDASWHERLVEAIRHGHIHVTGNYLNFTDLVDLTILRKKLEQVQAFSQRIGQPINTAISMDINGWSFGYSQVLYDAGIRRFYTCIHNHHGFVPFRKKHVPFYWETPKGDKILVWHGDVYNQGNVSQLTPHVEGYFDEEGHYQVRVHVDDEQLKHAKEWLDDYVESVKRQGYEYDFLPIPTKGILVDNAPCNPYTMESIRAFNARYGEDYQLEMIGINDFFDYVEGLKLPLKTYRGDWTDWWSDGYMSTPHAVMLYREAQRLYHQILAFKASGVEVDEAKLEALEHHLVLFAEHTWGYATSVSEPWNRMTNAVESRNKWYAETAHILASELLDDITVLKGEYLKAVGRPLRYKVVNPYPFDRRERIKVRINHWDEYLIQDGYEVVHVGTKRVIPHQDHFVVDRTVREIQFTYKVKAGQEELFDIIPKPTRRRKMPIDPLFTRDERYDFISPYLDQGVICTQFGLETPFVRITWKKDIGITSWYDKTGQVELIRQGHEHSPLTPVYEVTRVLNPYQFVPNEIKEVRRDFGRNRNVFSTERFAGRLVNTRVLASGPLFGKVELKYLLEGTTYATVQLTAYRDEPRVDVSFIVAKNTVWEPEALYLSLPFTTGQKDEVFYIEKQNCPIRPRIDQLPGTLTRFYTAYRGCAWVSPKGGLVIHTLDSPLLHLGTLEPGVITLMDGTQPNHDLVYSWLMNNYWETNFATNLGGFYEFRYILRWGEELNTIDRVIQQLDRQNDELPVFQSK